MGKSSLALCIVTPPPNKDTASHAIFYMMTAKLKGLPRWLGVKNLPANARKAVQSLGWEGHLKKETAAHPSILSWKIQRTEEPGGLQSIESQKIGHDLEAQQQQLQQSLKQ